MAILSIHQNFPAQFKHLAPALASDPRNEVTALTLGDFPGTERIRAIRYRLDRTTSQNLHPWAAEFETKIIRGEAAFRAALDLRRQGYQPDIIVAHPGWGESLFLKEVWPDAKLRVYCEFFYRASGADVGFDPEFPPQDIADSCVVRMKNANNMMHLDIVDAGISPTHWQKNVFPAQNRLLAPTVGLGPSRVAAVPGAWADAQKTALSGPDRAAFSYFLRTRAPRPALSLENGAQAVHSVLYHFLQFRIIHLPRSQQRQLLHIDDAARHGEFGEALGAGGLQEAFGA
jgi:hypothetical protein